VNSALRLDAALEVGSTGESITVSGSAPQVEIISTQNGEAINSKKMTTIPLNGRSYIDLLAIQPGVGFRPPRPAVAPKLSPAT
jgi:hypothetical protein